MVNLRYSQQSITEEDIQAVVDVLRSPNLTQGPVVEAFEAALAEYCGSKYAVAVNSGTAALHLAIEYLAPHEPPVVTSPISFVATANAVMMSGRNIDFCDIDPLTGNMNGSNDYWRSMGGLLIPVHYAGRPMDLRPLSGPILEDACHALGATEYGGGTKVGACTFSNAAAFSFHAVKPITTGEGGAITCNDQGLYEALLMGRNHGRDASGKCQSLGYNYRMSDIQAALGISQLKRIDDMMIKRLYLAEQYAEAFMDQIQWGLIYPPPWQYGGSWHLYPVRIQEGRRDEVKARLNAAGIGAQVHYPSIPSLPYYRAMGFDGADFPEAESFSAETLSLPLHAGMGDNDVQRVVSALLEALR